MATYYSGVGNGYRLRLVLTAGSPNIANNTTPVSYSLTLENTNAIFYARSNGKLTVAGSTRWNVVGEMITLMNYNSEVLLTSGSMTVKHGSTGAGSVPYSANFYTRMQGYVWSVPNLTMSGSMSLPAIDRTVWVKDGSTWRRALPYAKDGNTWKQAIPYAKDGSTWKQAG